MNVAFIRSLLLCELCGSPELGRRLFYNSQMRAGSSAIPSVLHLFPCQLVRKEIGSGRMLLHQMLVQWGGGGANIHPLWTHSLRRLLLPLLPVVRQLLLVCVWPADGRSLLPESGPPWPHKLMQM